MDSDIVFHVDEDSIVELKHESYKGRKMSLLFVDPSGDNLSLVLDIGVHTCC